MSDTKRVIRRGRSRIRLPRVSLKVSMNKNQLIQTVRGHWNNHGVLYQLAWEGYKHAVKTRLRKLTLRAERGELVHLTDGKHLPFPQDHNSSYRQAIEMLEAHSSEDIELTEQVFRRLVHDEWRWSRAWFQSLQGYHPRIAENYQARYPE